MNKWNIAVLAAIAVLMLVVLGNAQTSTRAAQSPVQIGRYQLFSAEYDMAGVNTREKVVLRIDTATGKVDQWMNGYRTNSQDVVDEWLTIGRFRDGKLQPGDGVAK